jgi:hypothetical protein
MLLPLASLLPEEQFFLVMEAHDPMYGPQAAYLSEFFGTRLVTAGPPSATSWPRSWGGVSPLIAESLLAFAGGH